MKKNKLILLILLFSLSFSRLTFKDYLPCGKEKPEIEKHCTKYGTDSGFVCCFIKKLNSTNNPLCSLISYREIEEIYHVRGKKSNVTVEDFNGNKSYYFFSCGNNSKYLKKLSGIYFVLNILFLI